MVKAKKSKHHGVRDPEKQREQREQKLIDLKKINNPPKEDQEVSKRFRRFMELKQAASSIGKKNKNKRITVDNDFMINEGVGKKLRNETNKQQLRRVEHLLMKKKQEAEYAKKYNVQIIRDEVTGEIKMKKDPLIKANQKKVKVSKNDVEKKVEEVAAAKKEQDTPEFPLVKYEMSAKQKRKLLQEEQPAQDFVKFGEVVKEPPTFNLPQKPNVIKNKKKNFLFMSKLSK